MRTRNVVKQELVKKKAIEMLVRHGFDGFSMNKLAKDCGVSVATLYVYYQDKDDLIKSIGVEIGKAFFTSTLQDFSPEMPFAVGLRKQWENRSRFALAFPDEVTGYEIIRHSPHGEHILQEVLLPFKETMWAFVLGAMARNELKQMHPEVFWSVAYGPLYTLLRFHGDGKGLRGKPFQFSDEIMEQALSLVLKALTP